jgi:hypothetical protein
MLPYCILEQTGKNAHALADITSVLGRSLAMGLEQQLAAFKAEFGRTAAARRPVFVPEVAPIRLIDDQLCSIAAGTREKWRARPIWLRVLVVA